MRRILAAICLTVLVAEAAAETVVSPPGCRIEVVEKDSGWAVPLVQLKTTDQQLFVSDNAGVVHVDHPDLLDRDVFFHVEGHGYTVPADGFGIRGIRLTLRSHSTQRVEVLRTILAQRLGRLTGAGRFVHDRAARERDAKETGLVGIVGCDSVQTAMYQDRQFWLWGDTTLLHYPLGIFHTSGATTPPRPITSFRPPLEMEYHYFREQSGRPRGIARMPGDGPTWLTALMTLPDDQGRPRLVASYSKIKPPLEAYEWGLCVWNDTSEHFEKLKTIWTQSDSTPVFLPQGHASFWTDPQGVRWVFCGNPLPTWRCRASFAAWQDPSQWKALQPQETLAAAEQETRIRPHSGSIAWNKHRGRWLTIFMQPFGKPSAFGELWYAEADHPEGPWGTAVKVLSHNNYTFYNPRLHPELPPEDASFVCFEGTYTRQFADDPVPTPRYDYNQILYRLDLDDPRLQAAQRGASTATPAR